MPYKFIIELNNLILYCFIIYTIIVTRYIFIEHFAYIQIYPFVRVLQIDVLKKKKHVHDFLILLRNHARMKIVSVSFVANRLIQGTSTEFA